MYTHITRIKYFHKRRGAAKRERRHAQLKTGKKAQKNLLLIQQQAVAKLNLLAYEKLILFYLYIVLFTS